jgi:hypothetical protein
MGVDVTEQRQPSPVPLKRAPVVDGRAINGHPLPPTAQGSCESLQIINDEKQFTSVGRYASLVIISDVPRNSPDLGTQIERWGLRDAGFAYNIVAVFGSQSTGKSEFAASGIMLQPNAIRPGTLLNRLFGTNFDVMDESHRQQTTKGALRFVSPITSLRCV